MGASPEYHSPHPEEPRSGVSKDGPRASWFETREDALLTMRAPPGSRSVYSFIPALVAACPIYFWVCWNALSSAFAFDMSPISLKCADTASGVQSDCARLM